MNAAMLAEELREYTAMKYAGDCKCGKCQLVPRELVERIYHTLNSASIQAASQGSEGGERSEVQSREAIARIVAKHMGDGMDAHDCADEILAIPTPAQALMDLINPDVLMNVVNAKINDYVELHNRGDLTEHGEHGWLVLTNLRRDMEFAIKRRSPEASSAQPNTPPLLDTELLRLREVAWAAQGMLNADSYVSSVPREEAVRAADLKLRQALGTWQMHHTAASACEGEL